MTQKESHSERLFVNFSENDAWVLLQNQIDRSDNQTLQPFNEN